MSLSEFRVAKSKAINLRKTSEYEQIKDLRDNKGLGWTDIAKQLNMSESSVRSKYSGNIDKKQNVQRVSPKL